MLKTQLNQHTIPNVAKDQLTSGLQPVWSILDHLRTGDGMATLVETRDLWNLEFKGDAQMLEYRTRWTYIVTNMVTVIPEKELSKLMYEHTRAGKSKGLEFDMADYRRVPDDDPCKNTRFLLNAMDRVLADRIRDTNMERRLSATQNGNYMAMAGESGEGGGGRRRRRNRSETADPAAPGKGKKGGKGKGK